MNIILIVQDLEILKTQNKILQMLSLLNIFIKMSHKLKLLSLPNNPKYLLLAEVH